MWFAFLPSLKNDAAVYTALLKLLFWTMNRIMLFFRPTVRVQNAQLVIYWFLKWVGVTNIQCTVLWNRFGLICLSWAATRYERFSSVSRLGLACFMISVSHTFPMVSVGLTMFIFILILTNRNFSCPHHQITFLYFIVNSIYSWFLSWPLFRSQIELPFIFLSIELFQLQTAFHM